MPAANHCWTTALVAKGDIALVRFPRRHLARLRHLRDQLAALLGVRVGQERKRRSFARPMAARALLKQYRRDVFVERRLCLDRGNAYKETNHCEQCNSHNDPCVD
jgi:hypothetical protein